MNEMEERQWGIEQAKKAVREMYSTSTADNIIESLDLALAALREQAEREKGCEICKDPRTFEGVGVSNKYNDRYRVYLCGGISRPPEDERFKLCPNCGKKLEVKQDG
jgi:hypothetical protein